jgi:predicted methyltransferase
MMALNLYSSNFYRKYQDILYPVVRYIHHTWLDTVVMENMKEFWAREQANTLKSVGLEMVLTIIEILTSYEVRRSISVAVRKNSYDKQNTIYEII